MYKKCSKCKIIKRANLENFKPHTKTFDKLSPSCRICIRIFDKKYQHKKRVNNPKYKKRESAEYRKKNPEKVRAHWKLNRAIQNGKIKRLPCIKCGEIQKIHAHHPDYSKPLKVIWLCPSHHKQIHNAF